MTDFGKRKKVAVGFFIFAVSVSIVIAFFVAFYLRSLERVFVTLEVGLFMGLSLALVTLLILLILDRIPGFLDSFPAVYTVILPLSALLSAIAAELLIFRMGAAHFYWIIGIMVVALIVGILLDSNNKLKKSISDSLDSLEKLYRQVIISLNRTQEIIEPYNVGHNERVAYYSLEIARRLGYDEEKCRTTARAGLLHDIGKIGISEKILLKQTSLESHEWDIIKHHPAIASRILKPLKGFANEIEIIRLHHEHFDGSGYEHLAGKDIPLDAKIIAVADAFDAMTTERPYRKAVTIDKALEEIKKGKGKQFDEKLVDIFIEYIGEGGNFQQPDYKKIREELIPHDEEDEIKMEESIGRVEETARRLSLLSWFYKLMGMSENYIYRHLFLTTASGLIFGLLLGLSVFSVSGDPSQLLSFFLQGITAGLCIFIVAVPWESLLMARYPGGIWEKPRGKFIIFFTSGLMGGFLSLNLVVYNFMKIPHKLDAWNITYILAVALISGILGFGADFFQKLSALLLINIRNLQNLFFELIYSLAFALEAKDAYTRGHAERVSKYSELIGRKMNLDEKQLEDLKLAALFHDIGKIGVQLSILHKDSRLDEEEFDLIKNHPVIGAEIIKPIKMFSHLSPHIAHHHENWDGSGYPDGFKGAEIPLYARVITVADAFDALITERPYKKGMPMEKAVSILQEESGKKFDPDIVRVFVGEIDIAVIAEIGKDEVAFPEVNIT
ncbi:MAG: HD-GYP domain-containing protein [Candidatus Eremiobacteraeota bacterium]|nr:HD-GYP domain-containing protein [Candidatus Eremiobacteraeota bacterium]